MEPFKLKSPRQQTSQPLIRLNSSYYQLLYRIKEETGLSLGCIIEQCIDYALENGGDREKELLARFTRPKYPAGCPLLAESNKERGQTYAKDQVGCAVEGDG